MSNRFSLTLLVLLALLASVAVFLPACGGRSHYVGDKPMVMVSIEPQRYLLEQVVGDGFEVRCLLEKGGDPESYDPTFANILGTQRSVAYMAIGGLGFEEVLTSRISDSNSSLRVYDSSHGIEPIYGTHGEPGEVDPHVWTSFENAKIMACNMAVAMAEIAPDQTQMFQSNCNALVSCIDSLQADAAARLAAAGVEAFFVWHPSLTYYARDFGLRQISLGGAEGKEMSPRALADRIDSASLALPSVLLLETGRDNRQALSINEKIGAQVRYIDIMAYDWLGQMALITDALTRP